MSKILIQPKNQRIASGFKQMEKWIQMTFFISGMQLALFFLLSFIFGIDKYKVTAQLSSFFFSTTLGDAFLRKKDELEGTYKEKYIGIMRNILVLSCLTTGVLYIILLLSDLVPFTLEKDSLNGIFKLVLICGAISVMLSSTFQFLSGFYGENDG